MDHSVIFFFCILLIHSNGMMVWYGMFWYTHHMFGVEHIHNELLAKNELDRDVLYNNDPHFFFGCSSHKIVVL